MDQLLEIWERQAQQARREAAGEKDPLAAAFKRGCAATLDSVIAKVKEFATTTTALKGDPPRCDGCGDLCQTTFHATLVLNNFVMCHECKTLWDTDDEHFA